MVVDTKLAILLVALFYIVVPVLIMFLIKNKKTLFIVSSVFAVLFLVLVFVMTQFDVSMGKSVVTVYPNFNGEWFNKTIHISMMYGGIRDVVTNSLMLIPIGGYIVIYTDTFGKKYGFVKALLLGVVLGFLAEALQFILPADRCVQLRDVILNALSAGVGYIIYYVILKIRNKLYKIN